MSPNLPAVIATPEPDQEYDGALLRVAQADTDRQLVELWVRRHESPNTRRNYRRQAERFLAFVNRPLAAVRLGDLQAYLATLDGRAPATRANAVAALKSLFGFAQETGFLRGIVNLMGSLVATRHRKVGHTNAYARAATPVTAAQVWKAWVRAARYWRAER